MYRKEYNEFFTSPAGEYLLEAITDMIHSEHTKAEDTPELSRDHMQRAKGMREVIAHVQSVTAAQNITREQITTP